MTAATPSRTVPSLLPVALRAGIAGAVVAFVAGAWVEAGHSSHQAVQEAKAALTRTYVTLPPVEIIGERDKAARVAALPSPRRTAF